MKLGIRKGLCTMLVLMLVSALVITAGGEGSRGVLYKVEHGGNVVYLLGSIHIGNQEMYPFGEIITEAMEASDIFVFECDTTSGEALAETLERMMLPGYTRLQDVIPAELYQRLEKASEKLGLSILFFSPMRPWAAMNYLAMHVTAAQMGMESAQEATSLGVETMVRKFANENGKAFGYLETVGEQLDVFDLMSAPLQEYLLNEALSAILEPENIRGMDATVGKWPGWWHGGNMEAFVDGYLENYLSDSLAEPEKGLLAEYHEVLLSKRNQTMADAVEGYLQGKQPHTYFVTVGLLHLILPEDSIIGHLQSLGYSVECLSVP